MFPILGYLLLAYVAYALLVGKVYAKSGIWGRHFYRYDEPWNYWSGVIAYALLSGALIFLF